MSKHEASTAVINFALSLGAFGAQEFLETWDQGYFDELRRNWPEAPESVYIGADPLHPETVKLQAATAAQEARMRELEGLHPAVTAFAKAMQHKLDKNKHKDGKGWKRNPDGSRNGWAGCSEEFLTEKLREEVAELLDALHDGTHDDIRHEAADVGNIAMMLADVRGALIVMSQPISGKELP